MNSNELNHMACPHCGGVKFRFVDMSGYPGYRCKACGQESSFEALVPPDKWVSVEHKKPPTGIVVEGVNDPTETFNAVHNVIWTGKDWGWSDPYWDKRPAPKVTHWRAEHKIHCLVCKFAGVEKEWLNGHIYSSAQPAFCVEPHGEVRLWVCPNCGAIHTDLRNNVKMYERRRI